MTRQSATVAAIFLPNAFRRAHRCRLTMASMARTGTPSWNRKPGRKRMRQSLPSGDVMCPSAICGLAAPFASME